MIEDFVYDDPANAVFKYRREAFTSPEVFDLERQKIFDRSWLYLGHESEVPNIGDFRRRDIAGRPLFFVRVSDSEVKAFYNTCAHRGARICRQDAGTSKVFQCFYHAWTFNTRGELVGVPDQDAYGPSFDRQKFGLKSPRHEEYRGLQFVCFSESTESLQDYLGNAAEYIDLFCDQAEDGLTVLPGTNLYSARANWKLYWENGMDGYHFQPTHGTYLTYLADQAKARPPELEDASFPVGYRSGVVRLLDNGHVSIETPSNCGRPAALWHPSMGAAVKPEIDRIHEQLLARHGEERGRRITENSKLLCIFPNLILLDVQSPTIRALWPQTPSRTDVTAWILAPKEESQAIREVRLSEIEIWIGGGGFGTPDDVEAVEACQEGASVPEVAWSDVSRGWGQYPLETREAQLRGFWREWQARLLDRGHADNSAEFDPDEESSRGAEAPSSLAQS